MPDDLHGLDQRWKLGGRSYTGSVGVLAESGLFVCSVPHEVAGRIVHEHNASLPEERTPEDANIRVYPRGPSIKATSVAHVAEGLLVTLRHMMRSGKVSKDEFLSALPPEWVDGSVPSSEPADLCVDGEPHVWLRLTRHPDPPILAGVLPNATCAGCSDQRYIPVQEDNDHV